MLFDETKQERMQIFKVVLFFKLGTLQKEAMEGMIYLLLVGRILPAT